MILVITFRMEENIINYIDCECLSCHKTFKKEDDVVVCPDCGTPYHRDCYDNEGKCINTELHEKNESWTPKEKANTENNEEDLKCPRCGETNPSQTLFCVKCGYPMQINQESRPFNDDVNQHGGPQKNMYDAGNAQNGFPPQFNMFTEKLNQQSDLDGNTIGEYTKFIGTNPIYHLTQFLRFAKSNIKTSINLMAFLFPEFYFFYRRMNKKGILMLVLSIVLSIPTMLYLIGAGAFEGIVLPNFLANRSDLIEVVSNVSSLMISALKIWCSLFANYWYYQKAKGTINACKETGASGDELNNAISNNGGVSSKNLIIAITAYIVIILLMLFGLRLL